MKLFSLSGRKLRTSENTEGAHHFFSQLIGPLYFSLLFIYMEQIFHITIFGSLYLNFSLFFLFPVAIVCALITSLFPPLSNRILAIILTAATTILFCSQLLYNRVFGTFWMLTSVGEGGVGQIWQFRDVIFTTILKNWLAILFFFLPLILVIVFSKKLFTYRRTFLSSGCLLASGILLHLVALLLLLIGGKGLYSEYNLYHGTLLPEFSMQRLGVITTFRLDAKYLIFGANKDTELFLPVETDPADSTPSATAEPESETSVPTETPIDQSPNIMDIDFETLIQNSSGDLQEMHTYFSQATPTNKNEYTGMFEGYNLIFLCAEGFSPLAIDEERTPTLYKMSTEGFVFYNFYNPVWGVSTSDGEYVNLTGLIPKSGVWSMKTSGKQQNDMYFTMGRQFERLGYTVLGYHDHTYSYYGRDLSHPNMGYQWIGVGNGLDIQETWPESDLEMMEKTIPDYIDEEHFHTYYMTVSGHLEYNFMGNAMAAKNRSVVEDLPYSETAQAYLACNYELEQALTYLIDQLEQKGIADNTLIVLSADHYPYGLVDGDDYSAYNELLGHEVEKNFELYKNALIIWSASMEEPVIVDKYCSTLDVIPTISNLLGLEYDSRLLMGTDIMSDSDPLVIFNNRSWITQECMYNSKTGEITPLTNDGSEITQDYIDQINQIVSNKTKLSAMILDYDYYQYIH